MSTKTFIRTLVAPPQEFAWAWALERPAAEPLRVRVVADLARDAKPSLDEDEMLVWFGVPGPGGGPDYFHILSEDEQVRAARFHFEADRWSFAAAHAGLRALLAPILGRPPASLRFALGRHGKPHLDPDGGRADVQFSISHTRGCVAVALAGRAVGVDVEQRRTLPDLMDVARTAFAPEAYDSLAVRAEPAARMNLFYRYWTLGEAFIKATGEGLAQGLTSFAFTEDGPPALVRVSAAWGPARRWRFDCASRLDGDRAEAEAESEPNRTGAIATRGESCPTHR